MQLLGYALHFLSLLPIDWNVDVMVGSEAATLAHCMKAPFATIRGQRSHHISTGLLTLQVKKNLTCFLFQSLSF